MTTLAYTYTLTNGTLADADQVMANFNNVAAVLNGHVDLNNLDLSIAPIWTGVHVFSATNLRVKGAGSGQAFLQNANTSSNRTMTIPDAGANDTFVSELSGLARLNSPNWINNLGLLAVTTTNSNDSIKLTSRSGSALSASNPLYASLPNDATPGQFEPFTFTSDITLKISGAHWGIDTTGNLTGAILRVGLINDGGATPALAVYYQGGRTSIKDTSCSATQANINLPEEILTNRAIAAGTWPIQEIGYFLADFTDATNVWAIQTAEIWPGKSADGRWQPWNPTFTGYVSTPAYSVAKWSQIGNMVHVIYRDLTGATSNLTITEITVPIKANVDTMDGMFFIADNSVAQNDPGVMQVNSGSKTCTLSPGWATIFWTGGNTKYFSFNTQYEAYLP